MRKTWHNRHQMSSGDTVLVADRRLKNEDVKVEVAEWGNEGIVEDLSCDLFVLLLLGDAVNFCGSD